MLQNVTKRNKRIVRAILGLMMAMGSYPVASAQAAPVLSGTAGPTSVSLSWTPGTDADQNTFAANNGGYRLWRQVTGGAYFDLGPPESIATGLSSSGTYTDYNLTGARTYTYKLVCAVPSGSGGIGLPGYPPGTYYRVAFTSNEVTLTPTQAPGTPTLYVTSLDGKPYFNWTACVNTSSYYVRRATSSSGPYTIVGNVAYNIRHFHDTTAANGVLYYYYVSAVNSGATQASNSNTVTATPTQ